MKAKASEPRAASGRSSIARDRLPPEISTSARVVLWKYERRDGNGKQTKVPYIPHRPSTRASVDDPITWGSFDDALAAVEDGKADGVGRVLGDGITVVDLDDCRDPKTGAISSEARGIIATLDSFTEISPSGTGVHIWCRGVLPPGGRRKGAIELYDSGRYMSVTGQHVAKTPQTIEERTRQLGTLHARIFGTNGKEHSEQTKKRSARPSIGLIDDTTLLERARAARNGAKFSQLWTGDTSAYASQSEADQALCNLLAFWTGADAARMDRLFRQSGLMREKWDERRGDQAYGDMTIDRAINGCRETVSSSTLPTESRQARPTRERLEAKIDGARNRQAARSRPTPTADCTQRDATAPEGGVALSDFYAYMPTHTYIFVPSREMWPASSVNARIPPQPALADAHGAPVLDKDEPSKTIKASIWLDQHQSVEQLTWVPGLPMLIRDRLVSDGGWIDRPGCACFNLYRPPQIAFGDARHADRWLDHIHRVYPDDVGHIVAWLAHRVQRPHEKINHALLLGGLQGIGKDTLLEPLKAAVGPWNFVEVSPAHLLGRFNGFVKAVILRVSEARDLGEVDRYAFYEHLKIYTAAPPDVLRVDEKNLREHAVFNVCGVVITTNHKTDGLYLPADDRRHYVVWSEKTQDDFAADYWTKLYRWYAQGGDRHVTGYLAKFDLSGFDPKATPPKTPAFWDIVDANRAPEDAELADALDKLGNPTATTLGELASLPTVPVSFADWLRDRKNARQVPHRMETAGYVPVRNPTAKDGLWRVEHRRQVIYAQHSLSLRDRLAAAQGRAAPGDR